MAGGQAGAAATERLIMPSVLRTFAIGPAQETFAVEPAAATPGGVVLRFSRAGLPAGVIATGTLTLKRGARVITGKPIVLVGGNIRRWGSAVDETQYTMGWPGAAIFDPATKSFLELQGRRVRRALWADTVVLDLQVAKAFTSTISVDVFETAVTPSLSTAHVIDETPEMALDARYVAYTDDVEAEAKR